MVDFKEEPTASKPALPTTAPTTGKRVREARVASGTSDRAGASKKAKTDDDDDDDDDDDADGDDDDAGDDGDEEDEGGDGDGGDSNSAFAVAARQKAAAYTGKPCAFLLWADALLGVLGGEMEESAFVRRTDDILSAFHSDFEGCTADNKGGAYSDKLSAALEKHTSNIEQWQVEVDEDDAATEQATALKAMFWSVEKEAKSAPMKAEKKESEDDRGEGVWWWEITAQQEEPAGDVPKLRVTFESTFKSIEGVGDGTWWFTKVAAAAPDARLAMELMNQDLYMIVEG